MRQRVDGVALSLGAEVSGQVPAAPADEATPDFSGVARDASARPRARPGAGMLGEVQLAPAALFLLGAGVLCTCAGRLPDPRVEFGYGAVFTTVFVLASLIYAPWVFLRDGAARAARQLGVAVASMSGLLIFQPCFAAFKGLIGSSRFPFRWDPFLASVDRAIHGGISPWSWIAPLAANPHLIAALEIFYNPGWLFVTTLMLTFAAWHRTPTFRFRFIAAYVLIWAVAGGFLAAGVSSAGPIFYGLAVPGRDPFAPLVAHALSASPLLSSIRDGLWEGHLGKGPAYGISAWPSIHIATSTLYARAGWARSRPLGMALTAVAVGMVFGSVALGWHYAIDAYAGIAIGLAGWALAGRLARLRLPRAATRAR